MSHIAALRACQTKDVQSPKPPTFSAGRAKPLQLNKSRLELKTPRVQVNAGIRNFKSEYQPRASTRIEHQPTRAGESSNINFADKLRELIYKPKQTHTSLSNKSSYTPAAHVLAPINQPAHTHASHFPASRTVAARTPAAYTLASHTPAVQTHATRTPAAQPLATQTPAAQTLSSRTPGTYQYKRANSEPISLQVKVNDKTYRIEKKIGSGGSSKVFKGRDSTTHQDVAIKVINMAQADPRSQQSYFNEISILKRLGSCEHVVRIFDSEFKRDINELVIVMELGDSDLAQVLDYHFKTRQRQDQYDLLFIKSHWHRMLLAVAEIHRHGIVHADLKPVNFIIIKSFRLKLIDFGIASLMDPNQTSIIKDYQIGTINYMAPEALENRAANDTFVSNDENRHQFARRKMLIRYNSKADIWSLGCILYHIVYGRPPFDKYDDVASKVQAISNPHQEISFTAINNIHLLNCMKLCLQYDPYERPTAEQLLNHEYLRNV